MIENLVCFKLNNMDRKVLLYTYNEPYNGMNEYLKIYALELDNNDNIVHENMNEEVHSQVKNAIAMMGKNQADSLTILPIPQINIGTTTGKAFAIPTIFKNGIREAANRQPQAVIETHDGSFVDNTITDIPNNNMEIIQGNSPFENETMEVKADDNVKLENTEIANTEPFVASTENIDMAEPFNYYESEQLKTENKINNESKNFEEYNPMDQFTTNNTTIADSGDSKIDTINNEPLSVDTKVPSLSEVDDALITIMKYVEHLKNKNKTEKGNSKDDNAQNFINDTISNSLNSDEIMLAGNEPESTLTQQDFSPINFSGESAFREDESALFSNEPSIEKEKNGYVAVQNIGQNPINNGVFTNNNEKENVEPVVMPDNFIGKQGSTFEITGLGPSTLSAEDNPIKYVA